MEVKEWMKDDVFRDLCEFVFDSGGDGYFNSIGDFLFSSKGAEVVLYRMVDFIRSSHGSVSEEFISITLGNYFVELHAVLSELDKKRNFTTKSERIKARNKVIKACDEIINNIDKLGLSDVCCYSKASDFSDVSFDSKDLELSTINIIDVAKFMVQVKRCANYEPDMLITKVSTRDAKFNYFCRKLRMVNEKWLGSPYWDGVVFFSYGLVENPPEAMDKVTAVRNACGLSVKK